MKEPKLRAFYHANSGQMIIIWSHYDDKPDKHGFVLYRNGIEIAKHVPGDEKKWGPFERASSASFLKQDRNTRLFKESGDAKNELLYVESHLQKYQEYEYVVEKIRYSGEGRILGSIKSRPLYVKTE